MTFDDRPLEQATPLLVMLVTEAYCSLSARSFVRLYELASKHHSPIVLPHCGELKQFGQWCM